jgi:hypothetical protein
VQAARRAGLTEIGFADHNPTPGQFAAWRMSIEDLPRYLEMVEGASRKSHDSTFSKKPAPRVIALIMTSSFARMVATPLAIRGNQSAGKRSASRALDHDLVKFVREARFQCGGEWAAKLRNAAIPHRKDPR